MDRVACLVTLAALVGCQGQLLGGEARPSSTSPATIAGRLPQRVWRLTPEQYVTSVQALLGSDVVTDTDAVVAKFPADPARHGIDNGAGDLIVARAWANETFELAEQWAEKYVQSVSCTHDACAQDLIGDLASRAYRRSLTDQERTALLRLYAEAPGSILQERLRVAVHAILASPQFIYRYELGDPSGKHFTLRGSEIATAIGYLATDGLPDEELLTDAQAGALVDADVREAHVRRLYASSGAKLTNFVREWLGLTDVPYIEKNSTFYPDFSRSLAEEMHREVEGLVRSEWIDGGGRFSELLTSEQTTATGDLATLYGGGQLSGSERSGILTRAATMATYARQEASSPVQRGAFVWRRVLCRELDDPPPDVAMTDEVATDGTTTRELTEAHSSDPACRSCHELIDPLGFAFEHYDGIGKFRDTENGLSVDTSGRLDGVAVTSAVELSHELASHPDVRRCFVQRLGQYMTGAEIPIEQEWLAQVADQVSEQDLVLEALVALVRHPAFVERAEGI